MSIIFGLSIAITAFAFSGQLLAAENRMVYGETGRLETYDP